MPAQRGAARTAGRVPQLRSVVPAAGHHRFAVRAERRRFHIVAVPAQRGAARGDVSSHRFRHHTRLSVLLRDGLRPARLLVRVRARAQQRAHHARVPARRREEQRRGPPSRAGLQGRRKEQGRRGKGNDRRGFGKGRSAVVVVVECFLLVLFSLLFFFFLRCRRCCRCRCSRQRGLVCSRQSGDRSVDLEAPSGWQSFESFWKREKTIGQKKIVALRALFFFFFLK